MANIFRAVSLATAALCLSTAGLAAQTQNAAAANNKVEPVATLPAIRVDTSSIDCSNSELILGWIDSPANESMIVSA